MKFNHEYSKLNKDIFTTIRKNTGFYEIGHIYQIQTPSRRFKAKVINSKLIKKDDIDDSLAQSDADMNATELIAMLEKWYRKFDNFALLVLEKI